MKASEQISKLAAQGRYHFSTREIAQIMGVPLTAVRAALRRLKEKGLIATPYRGFHVIVAPEYRGIGCLPADQFIGQLMEYLGLLRRSSQCCPIPRCSSPAASSVPGDGAEEPPPA